MPTAKISSPLAEPVKTLYEIGEGGTGATNLAQAAQNLNLLLYTDVGNGPGQVPLLNAQSLLSAQLTQPVQQNSSQSSGLSGPSSGYVGQTLTFLITDYDSFSIYDISVSAGSFVRNADTITYTAPASAGAYTLTVNSKTYDIIIGAVTVNVPSVISPINNTTEQPSKVTLVSSAFSISGGSGVHEGSDWQISTSDTFSALTSSVINSSTDKTTYTVTSLLPSTTYYARVRHKGTILGYSAWSPTISFTTKSSFLPTAEVAKLVASDGAASDQFGSSASVSGDGNTIIIGANGDDSTKGSAYVFTRSGVTWSQQAKLVASDGATSDSAGMSVSISSDGNTAIVSAYGNSTYKGAAYIFTRSGTTWSQQAKLVASDGVNSDRFGSSVSISGSGDSVIVGAPNDDAGKGSAYIFTRSGVTWMQQAKLVASDGDAYQNFGSSVAISSNGTRAVVSRINVTESPGLQAIYIYHLSGSTWTQITKFTPVSGSVGDYYGDKLAISGDGATIAVGAYADTNRGAVYIYTESQDVWTHRVKLVPPNIATNDNFGMRMCLSYNGTVLHVTGTTNRKTHVFSGSGAVWSQVALLTGNDSITGDGYGYAISCSETGDVMVTGARAASSKGAVYVFN